MPEFDSSSDGDRAEMYPVPALQRGHGKGFRRFKAALDQRSLAKTTVTSDFTLTVELTVHELNHQPRRCLNRRTASAVFHDAAQRFVGPNPNAKPFSD